MVEDHDKENKTVVDLRSTEEWLTYANDLVPVALEKAREVKGFHGRWKMIISKLEQIPTRLSDLSSHPCFSKNILCVEQLQAVSKTLNESLEMAEKCSKEKHEGKLQMQSDLDALSGKIDLNLRDCELLIKTGVLGEVALSGCTLSGAESTSNRSFTVTELLARLQIGHLEAKHKALDCLVEVMREDEKTVIPFFGRSSISALVRLAATSPRIREKTVTLICTLVESGSCEDLLLSEGILPPLIRILESCSSVGREKFVIALQKLSTSAEGARLIAGHGGVQPLTKVCCLDDSVSQASATCTLKNLSVVPDLRQTLAKEGVIRIMIEVLDSGSLLLSKQYAAECLCNLTLSNDDLKQLVITEGGVRSLLTYLDGGLPQQPAVVAIRNLVGLVSVETLISLGLLPILVNVLNSSSTGSQKVAAATICRICVSAELKRLVGESGCLPLLIKLLEAKPNEVREVAAQALAILTTHPRNAREVKRDARSVPSLVQLLDPSPQNTAKKYAVCCLGVLSMSKKCRKLMISYGAIGYLKKLTEMDIIWSKKLLERLQRGNFRNFFGKN